MHNPTIDLNGKILYRNRQFNDELIFAGKTIVSP